MKIKCLIVEDDDLAADLLKDYISCLSELELVGICENGAEAYEKLESEDIGLLFLDIQIPKLNGLNLIELLKNPPIIIITTSYSEYAVEGFRLNVTDYLLKPFLFERFKQSAYKAINLIQLKIKAEFQNTDTYSIFVKVDSKMIKIKLDDILFIEGLKQYIKIITSEKMVMVLQGMLSIYKMLPQDRFIRVHKSFIISKNKIEAIRNDSVEINNKKIPIGRTYKSTVLKEFMFK